MRDETTGPTPGLNDDELAMEAALAGLQPASASHTSRDQLMFTAGADAARRSQRRRVFAWQAVAALMALAAGAGWFNHFDTGRGGHVGSVAEKPPPSMPRVAPHVEPSSPFSALSLRNVALAHGLDALPSAPPPPGGATPAPPLPRPGLDAKPQTLNFGDSL